MDKSWISDHNKFSSSYMDGVQRFLMFAVENVMCYDGVIKCPCVVCNNSFYKPIDEVEKDIHMHGFSRTYVLWTNHGEKEHEEYELDSENELSYGSLSSEDEENYSQSEMREVEDDETNELDDDMEHDLLNEYLAEMMEAQHSNMDYEEEKHFQKLVADSRRELYPGCKTSSLLATLKLLHLKVMGKWTDKSFSMLLDVIKSILPEGETLPSSLYRAEKEVGELGLGYEEIDACKNGCVLFWKENEKMNECQVCKESRWQALGSQKKRVAHKKLRYFSLKPRLQKLSAFNKTVVKMHWHKEKRIVEEGVSRHPADSLAWKHVDDLFPQFSKDARNVRLGLACDGFTPWPDIENSHTIWPVILVIYNLPSYECMREPFLMMSLLISGPTYPGGNIDVYLQPLIEDLKELWDVGIDTYDVNTKERFQMYVILLWTISDLPGYSLLSGWQASGHCACPCCLDETDFTQLRTKTCYMGHRHFLPKRHPFHRNRSDFNGKEEHRERPKQLSGREIFGWLNRLHDVFVVPVNGKRKRGPDEGNWDKISGFYNLPYWHMLLIRHNLDPMHIDKNISDNVLGTLFNIKGKTKDTDVAREDLRDLGIRKELHIRVEDNKII